MKYKISDQGLNLIKSFESFRPQIYICPAGLKTIGYGHVIRPGESFKTLSSEQAEGLLAQDISHFEKAVERHIHTFLKQSQFDALVSFTFNVGTAALQRSTLRQKINRLEFDLAASEFLKWVYVRGRRFQGLVRRRQCEAALFQSSL